MNIHRLNQRLAAEMLSVTARTLRDWPAAPRNGDGTYDGPALVAWYVGREHSDDLDPMRERARRDAEYADKLAMDNAVRRGELARRADVVRAWEDLIAAARSRLLRLPADCRGVVPAECRAAVVPAVRDAVHQALRELAGTGSGE